MISAPKRFFSSKLGAVFKQSVFAVFVIAALGVLFAALIFVGAWLFSLFSWSGVILAAAIGAVIAFFVGWLFARERSELETTKGQLQEAKQILEIRVRARTRELEEFNQRLEQTIKAKTLELQQQVDELEKWRKLTVDRELKMVELKTRLQELDGQSNNGPKKPSY